MKSVGPRPSRAISHEQLSAPRRAVLEVLLDTEDPVTVTALAATLGQHANTVREHLEALITAGLATREKTAPQGRGRPALAYRPTGRAGVGGAEYAVLAEALIEQLLDTWPAAGERRNHARATGRRWARALAGSELGATDIMTAFTAAGFDPEPITAGVARLRRCPVLALARRHPDVVCQAHIGMVKELAGSRASLEPFAEPGACVLRVDPASAQ